MKCINVPTGRKPRYYTGKEPSPLGLGFSSHYENVGSHRRGKDGNLYMVGYSGLNKKRWVRVTW